MFALHRQKCFGTELLSNKNAVSCSLKVDVFFLVFWLWIRFVICFGQWPMGRSDNVPMPGLCFKSSMYFCLYSNVLQLPRKSSLPEQNSWCPFILGLPVNKYTGNKTEHNPYQKVKSRWTFTLKQSCPLLGSPYISRLTPIWAADKWVGRNNFLC